VSTDASAHDSGERAPSRNLRHLNRMAAYLGHYPLLVIVTILMVLASSGAELGIVQGMRFMIDEGVSQKGLSLQSPSLAIFALVAAVFAFGSQLSYLTVAWLSERIILDLRRDLFSRAVRLDASDMSQITPSEVQARLTNDMTVIQHVIATTAASALRNVCVLVGAAVLLLTTCVRLAVLVTVCLPFVAMPLLVAGRLIRKAARSLQDRLAEVGSRAEESVRAIRTVQSFNREDYELERFLKAARSARWAAMWFSGIRSFLGASLMLCVLLMILVVLQGGIAELSNGRITSGQISAFVVYALMLAASLQTSFAIWTDVQRAAGAAERIFELLDKRSHIVAPVPASPFPAPSRGEIELDRVGFAYPGRTVLALEDFTLHIRPGETVALVGPSGAGKSTIFHLLVRFYDPQQGVVRLDGVELRRADPAEIRARIALVSQDSIIFNTTPAENIRYGRLEATEREIAAAAEAAAAREFIEALPDGYRTSLGENGASLSGGQRQRIAIARSILKHASVLLLDEATASLDTESEQLVAEAIDRLAVNRTTVIIAHRLSTVLRAHRIVVMDSGRMVAVGTHQELLACCDLYNRLARHGFAADARTEGV
jgi:ATP-binding cassette subfamily B protein